MPQLFISSPPSALFSRARLARKMQASDSHQTNRLNRGFCSFINPTEHYPGPETTGWALLHGATHVRFGFWDTHSFSRRTLYCSSPRPPSTSWSSFVINSFSNWKHSQNFTGECHILRRGHEKHPAKLSRSDPTPLFESWTVSDLGGGDSTSCHSWVLRPY
jgi:hypothetical protein